MICNDAIISMIPILLKYIFILVVLFYVYKKLEICLPIYILAAGIVMYDMYCLYVHMNNASDESREKRFCSKGVSIFCV